MGVCIVLYDKCVLLSTVISISENLILVSFMPFYLHALCAYKHCLLWDECTRKLFSCLPYTTGGMHGAEKRVVLPNHMFTLIVSIGLLFLFISIILLKLLLFHIRT